MSLSLSRLSKNYLKLARPDVAQAFPRHIFLREPNHPHKIYSGSGQMSVKHENIFKSTLIHLSEPFDNTEIFLIGTMNTSDILATRTQKLIQDVKPDVVMVQAEEQWGQAVKLLSHVKSQEEMDLAEKDLSKLCEFKFEPNPHTFWHKIRLGFFSNFVRYIYGVPMDYNPFAPGLEVKYAIEEGQKLNSKIVYLGGEFDKPAQHRIYHETRNTILVSIYRYMRLHNKYSYREEFDELRLIENNYGVKRFIESSCDQYFINWFISTFRQIFPEMKRIFIEQKEEDLFKKIIENKGKKMVVLVNQFHLEGLEHHWCHSYGQVPRNARFENIDPIGDMPLRSMLFDDMYHVIMRDVKSSRFKSTPSSFSNEVNPYWRENNFQYEHRNM